LNRGWGSRLQIGLRKKLGKANIVVRIMKTSVGEDPKTYGNSKKNSSKRTILKGRWKEIAPVFLKRQHPASRGRSKGISPKKKKSEQPCHGALRRPQGENAGYGERRKKRRFALTTMEARFGLWGKEKCRWGKGTPRPTPPWEVSPST